MEQKNSLQKVKEDFEASVEQYFTEKQENLTNYYEHDKIDKFYFFLKYEISEEMRFFIQKETQYYQSIVMASLSELVEQEENARHCFGCNYHKMFYERLENRLQNIPIMDAPIIKPNNVLYQGYGAFGMVAVGIFILTTYLPFNGLFFHLLTALAALGVGMYFGMRIYRKFEKSYRQLLCEAGKKFLYENRRKMLEWFAQVVELVENDQEC